MLRNKVKSMENGEEKLAEEEDKNGNRTTGFPIDSIFSEEHVQLPHTESGN